jgi:hypothetical protein
MTNPVMASEKCIHRQAPCIGHIGKVESDFGAHTLTVNRVEVVSKPDPPLKKISLKI